MHYTKQIFKLANNFNSKFFNTYASGEVASDKREEVERKKQKYVELFFNDFQNQFYDARDAETFHDSLDAVYRLIDGEDLADNYLRKFRNKYYKNFSNDDLKDMLDRFDVKVSEYIKLKSERGEYVPPIVGHPSTEPKQE